MLGGAVLRGAKVCVFCTWLIGDGPADQASLAIHLGGMRSQSRSRWSRRQRQRR
jgi:hypothetical protein